MGARKKINDMSIKGAAFLGVFLALLFGSIPLGILAFLGLMGFSMRSGEYRPNPVPRQKRGK